ncbi:hypothetical protein [Streptomyces platensis]|uniref:hypothetical protein n=1 Tax=Streptomyces platensis TaxID=58346 RepID=UPI0036BF5571
MQHERTRDGRHDEDGRHHRLRSPVVAGGSHSSWETDFVFHHGVILLAAVVVGHP